MKCQRCFEVLPLVATVRAETYIIRVCRRCANEAEKLKGPAPGRLTVEWDAEKKEK